MKISIITMHAVYNYGSLLQTFATCVFFEELGLMPEIINYYPKRFRNHGTFMQLYREAKPFHRSFFKSMLVSLVNMPSCRLQSKKFEIFAEKYFNKTKPYYEFDELLKDPPRADIYCTGSDQVWNNFFESDFDLAYFLAFLPPEKIKIAYSASFGRDDISSNDLSKVMPYLKQYIAISVREESGLAILEDVKVSRKECLIDPIFMLTKEKWRRIMEPINMKNYILVYQLHEDSSASVIAIAISKYLNIPIIRLSTALHKRIRNGKTVLLPKVEEFLSYINNASLVITDSFHATAFSINLNVNFISVKWKMFNDRIQTMLNKLCLSDRFVLTIDEALSALEKFIDYRYVNSIIDSERARAKNFVINSLQL